jgi:outer membrane protein assembly factor BamB
MKPAGPLRHLPQAGGLSLLFLLCLPFCYAGSDWPQYRGANHDGISTDRINRQWTGPVTNPVWRVSVPNCLGSLAVSGGRVFTQTRRTIGGASREVCVALNATNGVELWATPVDTATYPDGGVGTDDGPRSTPAVEGESVFVLSSYLKLFRLNATNGEVIWQQDLRTRYGATVIGWQNAASPLLDSGLIYLNANAGSSNLMALRTSDGSLAWRSQNEAMTHSTPVLATIHGIRQVIFATQSGLVSVDPASGDRLWKFPYPFTYLASIGASPVVHEDMVFVCGAHAYGMGSIVVRASFQDNTWTSTRLWYTNNPASHWMTPVAQQGFLFGQFGIQQFDSPTAQLKCVDMRTGAVKWSASDFGRGATLLVDGHLLSLTERGQLVLVKPDPNAYTEVGRFTAIPFYNGTTNKCWNSPAVCDGRMFVRSTAYVACFDLSVPPLQIDPPRLDAAGGLQLTLRAVNGTPVNSNRLAGMEIRTTTNLAQPVSQWTALTNRPMLSNGVVRIEPLETGPQPQRYFIVREPQ